jgi:hypothetical protein
MEQELWACKQGSIKERLQRLGIAALVNVEVSRPIIGFISGQHRECEQNRPPREQWVKRLCVPSDGGEDVSVVIAEIRPREAAESKLDVSGTECRSSSISCR